MRLETESQGTALALPQSRVCLPGAPGCGGQRVHVDAAHHIPVPLEGTLWIAAVPAPSLDFLFPAAYRTLAACTPLRTSEALDAGCLRFAGKIGDVLAVFPYTHPLVV